jgi:hypothetical protein
MGIIEILWTATGVIVPLLLGTAWAMVGLTPPEFWIARGCVILAALFFGGTTLAWATNSEWSPAARILIAFFVAGVGLVAFSESIHWINGRDNLLRAQETQRATVDYAWGLSVQGIQPSYDPENKENIFELRPILKNVSGAPLKGQMTIEQQLGKYRLASPPFSILLPKDGSPLTVFPGGGFTEQMIKEFPSDRFAGTLKFIVEYGHPDGPSSRITKREFLIDVFVRRKENAIDRIDINWRTTLETDEPIKEIKP